MQLAGGTLLFAPWPLAAQIHTRVVLDWVAKPQHVHAAAMTNRNVLAPLMCCHLRH